MSPTLGDNQVAKYNKTGDYASQGLIRTGVDKIMALLEPTMDVISEIMDLD